MADLYTNVIEYSRRKLLFEIFTYEWITWVDGNVIFLVLSEGFTYSTISNQINEIYISSVGSYINIDCGMTRTIMN